MNWLFIGTLLGSIVTSGHDTKEACEGRKVILQEKGVAGQCVGDSRGLTSGTSILPRYCTFGNTVGPC